jgi:hypothetical protein
LEGKENGKMFGWEAEEESGQKVGKRSLAQNDDEKKKGKKKGRLNPNNLIHRPKCVCATAGVNSISSVPAAVFILPLGVLFPLSLF